MSSSAAVPGTQVSTGSTFAFISNFESLTLEGWKPETGSAPTVVTSVNYSGEPALRSQNAKRCSCSQLDYANKSFVDGLSVISFQVAIRESPADAFFGLGSSNSQFVAVVGVENGSSVVAGGNLNDLKTVEPVPVGTAQPLGWVYIAANVLQNGQGKWKMQVFVDVSNSIAANLSVPAAGSYSRALIETTGTGTAYYSDIGVSSTLFAKLVRNWNPMEGYGQGGACLCSSGNVQLLPLFSNLSATMTLSSWSVPKRNILSFQINTNNLTGSTIPKTCVGFFQLGLDLNPDGYIAPWYVIGNNCVAHYFDGTHGVYSPPGSNLSLSILFESKSQLIQFRIVDETISQKFTATIPYQGQAFDSMFTQLEFQPSGNVSIIQQYQLRAEMYNLQITTLHGSIEALPSSYMLPWSVDAPASWELGYYQNEISGYAQSSY